MLLVAVDNSIWCLFSAALGPIQVVVLDSSREAQWVGSHLSELGVRFDRFQEKSQLENGQDDFNIKR